MKAAALLLLSLGLGLAGVVGVAAAPNRTDVFGLDPEGMLSSRGSRGKGLAACRASQRPLPLAAVGAAPARLRQLPC